MGYIDQLRGCRTEEEFREIWDSEKFNWEYSYYLCIHCSKYFNIWWNPEKFYWKWSHFLCKYCSEYIHIWWDPKKFNWQYYSDELCKYCSEYKDIWQKDYIIKKLEGEIK